MPHIGVLERFRLYKSIGPSGRKKPVWIIKSLFKRIFAKRKLRPLDYSRSLQE